MSQSLGRGLSSLIQSQGSVPASSAGDPDPSEKAPWLNPGNQEVLQISPKEIVANPYQPRHYFSEESLEDLMNSIREHGILQPITVTEKPEGGYELVAGERRLRAAQKVGLKKVPALLRTAGQLEKLELSLIENIQRQDLNPIERARAYKRLVDEFSLTHDQVGQKLGKSRPVISNHLRILELPDEVVSLIERGLLTETLAIAILEIDSPEQQKAFAQRIVEEHLTKREARQLIRKSGVSSSSGKREKKDPLLRGYEDQLQSALATKVSIGKRGKHGWVIEVEAYSDEELRTIIGKIIK